MTQIPEYRAKKIDSDEWIEGYILPDTEYDLKETSNEEWVKTDIEDVLSMWIISDKKWSNIDPSTLAIYFDKKDKNNKPIFFSFSEYWIGGCIVKYKDLKYVAVFDKKQERSKFIDLDGENALDTLSLEAEVEVIGIHKDNK